MRKYPQPQDIFKFLESLFLEVQGKSPGIPLVKINAKTFREICERSKLSKNFKESLRLYVNKRKRVLFEDLEFFYYGSLPYLKNSSRPLRDSVIKVRLYLTKKKGGK